MEIAIFLCELFIAVLMGVFLASLFKRNLKQEATNRYKSVREKRLQRVAEDPEKKFAYDAMEAKMLANGIKYRMGAEFSPFDYTVFRLLVAFGVGMFGLLFHVFFFPVGLVIGFFLVPYYFDHEDKYDNAEMLGDIGRMNNIVALQVRNGVFVSKVIYTCYKEVKHPRLKKALLELSIDMENFESVKEAAELFRKKFNNGNINTFAKTLEQMQDTGQSISFFEGIVKNVERINDVIVMQQERKNRRTAFVFTVFLLIGPLVILLYILVGMIKNGALMI